MADPAARPTLARITDLRQVRAIANPLRIRMLQLFAQGPLTTKQVADRLGEKPTRLYNHARTLERAGLVRLVRTTRNRGTTERYLEAVGSRFEVDESLFAMRRSGSAARAAVYATASAMLRDVAQWLDTAIPAPGAAEPMVGQAAVRVTPREYEQLRAQVLRWFEGLQRRKARKARSSEAAEAVLTVALLPPGSAAGAAPDNRSRPGRSGKRDSPTPRRSSGRPPGSSR
jgi:DNA-binding transcriptional ArsR family regulator